MAPDSAAPAPTTTRRQHVGVLAAAVAHGISGYLVLLIAARTLGPAENAHFLVFWGALFVVYGVLVGLAAEVTRAVHSGPMSPAELPSGRSGERSGERRDGVPVARVALGLAGTFASLVALSLLVWGGHLFGDDAVLWSSLLVVGAMLFSVHAVLVGIAAGRGHWSTYSFMVGAEPVGRLLVVVVVVLVTAEQLGFVAASAAASGYWLLLVLLRRPDLGWTTRARIDARGLLSRLLGACAASAASSVLLVGFPVLVQISSTDAELATAAPLILSVSLCRAPLMVPLGAYQNVVITKVIAHGLRALREPIIFVAAGTAVGVVGAWTIGPWSLRQVNPDYHLSGTTLALLVLSAGTVCVLSLTGAASLALDRHHLFVLGWVVANVAMILVLLGPGDLTTRTVVSLLVAPPLGVAAHLLGLSRPRG